MALFRRNDSGSSDRVTANIASQNARAAKAAEPAFPDADRRANPRPHKVDKSVLQVKNTRRR